MLNENTPNKSSKNDPLKGSHFSDSREGIEVDFPYLECDIETLIYYPFSLFEDIDRDGEAFKRSVQRVSIPWLNCDVFLNTKEYVESDRDQVRKIDFKGDIGFYEVDQQLMVESLKVCSSKPKLMESEEISKHSDLSQVLWYATYKDVAKSISNTLLRYELSIGELKKQFARENKNFDEIDSIEKKSISLAQQIREGFRENKLDLRDALQSLVAHRIYHTYLYMEFYQEERNVSDTSTTSFELTMNFIVERDILKPLAVYDQERVVKVLKDLYEIQNNES